MDKENELLMISNQSRPMIDAFRLILFAMLCINFFGLPSSFGKIVQTAFEFVPISFFMTSGYLVLRKSPNRSKRILRTVMRTAIVFFIVFVFYLAVNALLYYKTGVLPTVIKSLGSKRLWFNFLVLNIWPFEIGSSIWYLISLLYAYIIIFFLEKLNLLRFDWLIIIICLALAFLSGEFSIVFKFNIFGYPFIPVNFLTTALPYVLLGNFIDRKSDVFCRLDHFWYYLIAIAGILLMFAERFVLFRFKIGIYFGHLIGMPITAAALCIPFFDMEKFPTFLDTFLNIGRKEIAVMCCLVQPLGVGIAFAINSLGEDAFVMMADYIGIISFFVCFFIGAIIGQIKNMRKMRKRERAMYE